MTAPLARKGTNAPTYPATVTSLSPLSVRTSAASTAITALAASGFVCAVGDVVAVVNYNKTQVLILANLTQTRDTGWLTPTFASGYAANYGSGFRACKWRQIGNRVFLKGLMSITAAIPANGTFMGIQGASEGVQVLTCMANNVATRFDVGTTGGCYFQALMNPQYVSFDGISYLVD